MGPAVAEALNVVAGAIVARILGAGGEFELRPPVSGGTPIGEVCAFNADGGQVQLWWAA